LPPEIHAVLGVFATPEFCACNRTAIPPQHLLKPIGITSQYKLFYRTIISESPALDCLPFKANSPKPSFQKLSFGAKPGAVFTNFRLAPIHISKTQPLPRSPAVSRPPPPALRHNHT
jgi:hypothetical protein